MARGNRLTMAPDRALYVGELAATGLHRHAAVALLVGLSGRFAVHLAHGRVEHCRSVLVDIGVEHVFDPCGEQVALVYMEPDAPEVQCLRPLLAREGGVLFDVAIPVGACSPMEGRLRAFDLPQLLRLPVETAAAGLDPRVARSLQALRRVGDQPWARGGLAQAVGLSPSRFNHLFREEAGVSFRSYRIWCQVRAAMTGAGPLMSLTDAALQGAFADSSHFSRTFRATFGMTPSSVLQGVAREVVG
ncbi:helix-turn-helix transcriptional regulator [Ramlibacter rhizophilus]|uniref:AraC family transcriptional regulator n=1 Tax=Ramlibacter rhizophilus TaxID=1781167 RepID=A0A4Z0C020_9BURK|nr:helix-turn-helix transcriptional regulator [Ramlibacter rhizophilus]TFZ04551.1 AraC family transcriptional regulator [Ramlibacter rhizophilus]